MESRQHGKLPGSKQEISQPSDRDNATTTTERLACVRPLSDIRELTEPSLLDVVLKQPKLSSKSSIHINRQSSLKRGPSIRRGASVRIVEPEKSPDLKYEANNLASSNESTSSLYDNSSMYSIPISSIPLRASSYTREGAKSGRSIAPKESPKSTEAPKSNTIPNHGYSCSPVKQASARLDPVTAQTSRRIPSRTFIRTPQPRDILDFPTHRHPRISLDMQVAAPLFVGGGSIEGHVRVVVDEAERIRQKKNLTIGRLAIDVLGVEETSNSRRSMFLSLGTELLDSDHPPPRNMVDTTNPHTHSDSSWTLMPSFTSLPFRISLPLDTGPPPFHSKHARIRFILCATLVVKDSGKQFPVRCSQDIAVLSTYDPEKALRSLPSPLTASDEFTSCKLGTIEAIKVTAGLHRQVWVGGSTIFVDIHIANNSRKTVKKLELSLERDILCYRHAAAATLEQSASQARIFESNDRSILSRSCLKQGAQGWTGVEAYGSVTRTCDLDLPRGHATVKCGKYFEVRYFLNLCVSTSHTKLVSVQLPIILIHMNSLDVVPNSVAQVAAAIQEKRGHDNRGRSHDVSDPGVHLHGQGRSHTQPLPSSAKGILNRHPSNIQGRAFAAPRQQSIERKYANEAEIHRLGALVNISPRKYVSTTQPCQDRTDCNDGVIPIKRLARGKANPTIVSRPAREIHKQPSNLSLGGISVGSYTIFNDSSSSGGGMEYITPPSKRKGRIFNVSTLADLDGKDNHEVGISNKNTVSKRSMRSMRSVRSFGSSRSKQSSMKGKSKWIHHFGTSKNEQNLDSRQARSALGHHQCPDSVDAHVLGLTSHVAGHLQPRPSQATPTYERPKRDRAVEVARVLSWRAKDDIAIDRGRFEFKAVKKKESGGFKEWLAGWKGSKQDSSARRANWL